MKTSRLVALSVIIVLLAADVAGAMFFRQAWQARHGASATQSAQSGAERDDAVARHGTARQGPPASL